MREKIEAWKSHVREVSSNPDFIHHEWFVQWHLEIVERIAFELCEKYPEADQGLVEVMVWLHDYAKPIVGVGNEKEEYRVTLSAGSAKLIQLGFSPDFVKRAVSGIDTMNRKMELDLHEANIEVQIVANADGCSHMVGPFMSVHWRENPGLSVDEYNASVRRKLEKDWTRKITLPEARAAFQPHYDFLLRQADELPVVFL